MVSGFRVQGSGFGVRGSGFGVRGSGAAHKNKEAPRIYIDNARK